MHQSAVKSETIYGLMSRVAEKPVGAAPLDPGVIAAGTQTVIELNGSDRDAVYHYVSHLMRKIAGCHKHYVLKPSHAMKETAVPENEPLRPVSRDGSFSVLVVDELMMFDVRHFAATVPSADCLAGVGLIQDPDSFVCLASLSSFLSKAAVFLSELRLVVLFCSDLMIDQVLDLLRRDSLKQCCTILASPHVPGFKTPPGCKRLQLRTQPGRHISVTKWIGDTAEETEVQGYDVIGPAARKE